MREGDGVAVEATVAVGDGGLVGVGASLVVGARVGIGVSVGIAEVLSWATATVSGGPSPCA